MPLWNRPPRLGVYTRFGAIAGAMLVLAACEVSEASGPGPGRGGYCPRIYDPVCAARGSSERTFANSCEARAAGWRIEYGGECRRGWRDGDWRDRDRWDRDRDRDRWDRDRDRWDRDRDRGDRGRDRPRDPVAPPPPPPPPVDYGGACPQVIQPVCGQVGSQTMQFNNECEMLRAGGNRVADGLCMGGAR